MNEKTPNHKEKIEKFIVLVVAIIFLFLTNAIVTKITKKKQNTLQIGESISDYLNTSNEEKANERTIPSPIVKTLTEHSACSTDENPWYNNESVEVKIEKTKDIDNEEYRVMYAIIKKEKTNNENGNIEYKELAENSETISITEEGKTEIIAYTENKEGEKSEKARQLVQIDRTAPTVGGIDYSEEGRRNANGNTRSRR